MALTDQTLLDALDECFVPGGPCAGAYRYAPGSPVNWYFASVGLLAFVKERTANVKGFLDAYVAHLNPGANIFDLDPDTGQPIKSKRDSDDAYAGVFLSLVSAYVTFTNDTGWLSANLSKLQSVVTNNIVNARYANGLTHTFQSAADSNHFAYLEDNCEVYRGLVDYCAMLDQYGYGMEAATISPVIAGLLFGIEQFYVPSKAAWNWAYTPEGGFGEVGIEFYPSCTSQIFPQALGVPISAQWMKNGYKYVQKHAGTWPVRDPDGTAHGFPWVIVAYAAALQGDKQSVTTMLDRIAHLLRPGGSAAERSEVTINEVGWSKRILDLML